MGIMTKLCSLFKTRIWKSTLDDSTRNEMYCEMQQSVYKVGRTLTSLLDDCDASMLVQEEQEEISKSPQIIKYASAESEKND